MSETQISIKDVEKQVFREFKAESIKDGLKIGKALTMAMKLWLETRDKKPKMSILDFKPRSWGKGKEKTSEEIDNILY